MAAHGARHLARRTSAGTRRQVDLEIFLGEVGAGGSFGYFGDQGAPGIGKLRASVAIPIRGIGDGCGYRQPGVLLTLGHQLQRTLGIAGQYRYGRDELALWVHGDGGLVAIKTLAATLAPMARPRGHVRIQCGPVSPLS